MREMTDSLALSTYPPAFPIRYVAAVFGVQDSETAIRWLILMMVLTCDPLAIAPTAAASARR
jgi:hypothetical protein